MHEFRHILLVKLVNFSTKKSCHEMHVYAASIHHRAIIKSILIHLVTAVHLLSHTLQTVTSNGSPTKTAAVDTLKHILQTNAFSYERVERKK